MRTRHFGQKPDLVAREIFEAHKSLELFIFFKRVGQASDAGGWAMELQIVRGAPDPGRVAIFWAGKGLEFLQVEADLDIGGRKTLTCCARNRELADAAGIFGENPGRAGICGRRAIDFMRRTPIVVLPGCTNDFGWNTGISAPAASKPEFKESAVDD